MKRSAKKEFPPTLGVNAENPKHEGYYIGSRSFEHDGKSLFVHGFKALSGKRFGLWGCAALDNQMPQVPLGAFCEVSYLGEKVSEKSGRTFKDIEVLFDDEKVIDPRKGDQDDLPF